jgi:hypothetical protein
MCSQGRHSPLEKACPEMCLNLKSGPQIRKEWLRGLDSNQDSQLQRLMSYQLDDPGVVGSLSSLLDTSRLANPATPLGFPPLHSKLARGALALLHVECATSSFFARIEMLISPLERWPSGLRRTLGKRV